MALAIAVMMTFAACEQKPTAPARAAGVPPSAVWGGGADGGAWFDCRRAANGYQCSVYDDYTGELWGRGCFVVRIPPKGNNAGKPLRFEAYDGVSGIALAGEGYMEKIGQACRQ